MSLHSPASNNPEALYAKPRLEIVVPVFNDDAMLQRLLHMLSELTANHRPVIKVIVVSGVEQGATCDSVNTTAEVCEQYGAEHLTSAPSRGGQIAAGLRVCQGPMLWVLHADATPSAANIDWLLAQEECVWGRFDVRIGGLALVAWSMNQRSRVTSICTGDQGMFLGRELFSRLDAGVGFPDQPLLEDVELSKRLRRIARASFRAPNVTIGTSPRRWRSRGVVRTILSMWGFRLRYAFGVSPETLRAAYYDQPAENVTPSSQSSLSS